MWKLRFNLNNIYLENNQNIQYIVNTDRIQKQAIIAFINLSPKKNIHCIIMTIIASSLLNISITINIFI